MIDLSGVIVATVLPYDENLAVDYDRYAEHVEWLAASGCRGVAPNGSLGEYASLTPEERSRVVETAVAASPPGFVVMPGVASASGHESRRWAEQAAAAGANAVMALPPNMHRANRDEVLVHFAEVAKAGLPICVYNNPIDTKVDLVPDVLADLSGIDEVVAVKEFSGDVRRVHEILELAPRLQILAGADDVLLESAAVGATGWVAGFPNVFPEESVRLFTLCRAGNLQEALPLYRALLPAFRWDSRTEFVQAIKLGMELIGRYGGQVRLPRLALPPDIESRVAKDMERAIAALSAAS